MDPVALLLFCPNCTFQHIDAPNPDLAWTNPPHRSHLCGKCGYIWRPADVPTVGVKKITSKGRADQSPRPRRIRFAEKAEVELFRTLAAGSVIADIMRPIISKVGKNLDKQFREFTPAKSDTRDEPESKCPPCCTPVEYEDGD